MPLRWFGVFLRPDQPPFPTPFFLCPPYLRVAVQGRDLYPHTHSLLTHGCLPTLCLVPENEAPVDTNLIELDTK